MQIYSSQYYLFRPDLYRFPVELAYFNSLVAAIPQVELDSRGISQLTALQKVSDIVIDKTEGDVTAVSHGELCAVYCKAINELFGPQVDVFRGLKERLNLLSLENYLPRLVFDLRQTGPDLKERIRKIVQSITLNNFGCDLAYWDSVLEIRRDYAVNDFEPLWEKLNAADKIFIFIDNAGDEIVSVLTLAAEMLHLRKDVTIFPKDQPFHIADITCPDLVRLIGQYNAALKKLGYDKPVEGSLNIETHDFLTSGTDFVNPKSGDFIEFLKQKSAGKQTLAIFIGEYYYHRFVGSTDGLRSVPPGRRDAPSVGGGKFNNRLFPFDAFCLRGIKSTEIIKNLPAGIVPQKGNLVVQYFPFSP